MILDYRSGHNGRQDVEHNNKKMKARIDANQTM